MGCWFSAELGDGVDLVLSVAVARAPGLAVVTEALTATVDGVPVALREVPDADGVVLHRVDGVGPGHLDVRYEATVAGRADPPPVRDLDVVRYLQPSRYAESDVLVPFARNLFLGAHEPGPPSARPTTAVLVREVTAWVRDHLDYVSGSSRPTDGAVATLLARQGVCRDFAHLVVALLRACDVPARVAAVYAPGLSPMDLHAVAEALVDGRWVVADATGLAPRASMLRISTGRDTADTAFLSTHGGAIEMGPLEVGAVVDDDVLPFDDPATEITL